MNFKPLFLFLILTLFYSCKNKHQTALEGKLWKGAVFAGKHSVTIHFAFDKNFFGNLQGKITIPDQSLYEIEAATSNMRGDSMFLEFSGALNAKISAKVGGGEILGAWEQGGHSFGLNLKESPETLWQVYMERALSLAENNSVYKQNVDWKQLRGEVMKVINNAESADDLVPGFQLILRSLNDKHGFMRFGGEYIRNEIDELPKGNEALKKAAYGHNKDVVSAQIAKSVGYLRIPMSPDYGSGKEEAFNQEIQKQVCELISKGTKNWIIDLRLNEGGSIFPMLSGINALVGEGKIGSGINGGGTESVAWIMKNGNYYNGEEQLTTSGKKCNSGLEIGQIAVLIGPLTASSGEAVAIALRGLKNTKYFGEPTRARSTGVPGYGVGKDMIFFFSTSFYADRNGQVYKNGISPDVLIKGGDNFKEIEKDSKVQAVLKWFQD